jgi:hypothetical protein
MNQQVNRDLEHLKILSILFYVLAGLTLFPIIFGLFYAVMGLFFGAAAVSASGEAPAALFGGIFVIFGGIFVLVFATLGFLIFKAGRNLSKREGYTFAFVIACVICLWIPLGTILGVFTIIVLTRDSVKALFNGENYPQYRNTPPNWQ